MTLLICYSIKSIVSFLEGYNLKNIKLNINSGIVESNTKKGINFLYISKDTTLQCSNHKYRA